MLHCFSPRPQDLSLKLSRQDTEHNRFFLNNLFSYRVTFCRYQGLSPKVPQLEILQSDNMCAIYAPSSQERISRSTHPYFKGWPILEYAEHRLHEVLR